MYKSLLILLTIAIVVIGCAEPAEQTVTPDPEDQPIEIVEPEVTEEPEQEASTDSVYVDGTYSASGSYQSPAGPETIGISLTVEDDVVTGVDVTPQAEHEISVKQQTAFSEGISGVIVGMQLDEVGDPGKVSTSSLSGGGFADAVNQIREQARS